MKKYLITILFFIVVGHLLAEPIEYIESTMADFSGGDTVLIEYLTPDPDGVDDCAIALTSDDTIRVLQVYPDGHCTNCIADAVSSYMHLGNPSLNIKIEVIPLSQFNGISSPSDLRTVYDPESGASVGTRCMNDYHIVIFGIANGFGGRGNDLSESARGAVVAYARQGGGIMLTHDTIAKRRGWSLSEPWCLDLDYEHPRFNSLTPVTGLNADWVPCAEPTNIYNSVTRHPGADPTENILHYPFHLPEEFEVTDCHAFGENFADGRIWYRGPDGQIYMHSFHDPEYDLFASYFSTGHQEEFDGDDFRPLEWETKGMINAMFYAFYGGRGNGVYTSETIDFDCPIYLDSVALGLTLPGSSFVVVEIRISNDGMDWSDWYEITPGSSVPVEVHHSRYFQYRLSLSRGNPSDDSPIVHWVGLYGEQDIPELEIILPPPNSATACSCGNVAFLIHSDSPLSLDGCRVEFDGIDYGEEYFVIYGDTLYFDPPDCYEDGDTHTIIVERILNEEGCVSEPVEEYSFTVDLSPPIIIPIFPPSDTAIGLPFDIYIYIADSSTAVNEDSLVVTVDGETLETGLIYTDDTLTIPAEIVSGLEIGDSTEICVYAEDTVSSLLCGPNDISMCWTFYVDTTAPQITCDTFFYACDTVNLWLFATDDVQISHESIVISVDDEIYNYPDSMHIYEDSIFFTPRLESVHGDTLNIDIYCEDIFGNSSASCPTVIYVDLAPPEISTEPANNDTVENPQPTISICLNDMLSGLDSLSSYLILETDTFWLDDGLYIDTCLLWSAESLGISFMDNDSLPFEIYATDLVEDEFCGPNILDTNWTIYIKLPAPTAEILQPQDGSCVSCSLINIIADIWSGAELIEDSLLVIFNSETLSVEDAGVDFMADSIIFSPSEPFSNGDSIYFEVYRATDSFGSTSEHLTSTNFIIDLSPPQIFSSVSDGDTVLDPIQSIVITALDSLCGVSEIQIYYGDTLPIAIYDNEHCLGDSVDFEFSPDDYDTYFPEEEISTVGIIAIDCGQYCEPNRDSITISFFVPDDDTIPPVMISYAPDVWFEDSSFKIILTVVDSSGIYAPANPGDSQDGYLLWDSDGELVASNNRAELYIDSINADTMYLFTEIIPEQSAYVPLVWRAFFYDDDFDFERLDDRLLGYTEIESVHIIPRPKFIMVSPPESIFTSCQDERIKIFIDSDDPIQFNSLIFIVADETLSLSHSRCYMNQDTFIIIPPYDGYDEGWIDIRLIEGYTQLGYSVPEQYWTFVVDITAPEIVFQSPSEWDMIPESQFEVIAQISDQLAGTDTNSISAFFVVRNDTLQISSISAELFGTGYRVGIPNHPEISPGDTVNLHITVCDLAQLCPSNCRQDSLTFWVEPDFPCSLSTNPFTPNNDGFNDEVRFLYPKPFSHSVTLCIYDLGGRELFCRNIPAGDLSLQLWDGTRKGKNVPAGTYIYVIEGDGIHCRGTVTLAR
ncbi:hypothetical protein DRQ33_02045 [bacterium]|nr:MAG: hypothetical protein DRQ33_02045 [bacterium]